MHIFIEISGICQAKCPYCLQRSLKQGQVGGSFMDTEKFSSIVEHLMAQGLLHPRDNITLFSWGEPLLNPQINDILDVMRSKHLTGGISSNFIKRSIISEDNLKILDNVTFSISGFSQETYGRIHGAPLSSVLRNFESFYSDYRRVCPDKSIKIAWHRYRFNEHEFWNAFAYFNRPGLVFTPYVAYLNDLELMLELHRKGLEPAFMEKASKELFLDYIQNMLTYHSKLSKDYHCPALDTVVIDDVGNLLLCCGAYRHNPSFVLGNVMSMSFDEIISSRMNHAFCKGCITSGVARFGYATSVGGRLDVPWPSGPFIDRFLLWKRNRSLRSFIKRALRSLPQGDRLIDVLRKMRHRSIAR